jgi:polyhydroxybutyrate depolymerase
MLKYLLPWAVVVASATVAQAECGDVEDACEVDEGAYLVALPDGDIKGSIMFLHGFGGSGKGSVGQSWVKDALARGYAVIGPDGTVRDTGRPARRWSFHPDWPAQRDEIAFLTSVRDDAAERFDLDADKMILGGFSIGGSMTSYLACAAPEAFDAYLPVGGGFWRPHPTECVGPVRLLHTHGWTDTTVPLEGRVVRGEDINDPNGFVQGDIFYTLGMWREVNECVQSRADKFVTKGPFMRRSWDRCAPESALEFALFSGGHRVPKGWADLALDWLENL